MASVGHDLKSYPQVLLPIRTRFPKIFVINLCHYDNIPASELMSQHFDLPASNLTRGAFVARFGGVYEHSPWIAEAAFDAGLTVADDAPEALAARLAAIVEAAGRDRQLALLRAHPELAGKLAVRGELTADSRSEQASARLDQCSPEEFQRFTALNEQYGAKFGFPFIIAVRGLKRDDILRAFEVRIDNSREVEFRTALDQVHRIARLRVAAMETASNS